MPNRLSAMALALALSAAAHAAPPEQAASTKSDLGFGIGALVGGLLGGPPGAVIGAAGGAWIGAHEHKQDKARAAMDAELTRSRSELAALSSKLAKARAAAHAHALSLEELRQGVSFDVYFRTDKATIEPELRRQLAELAETLRSYPGVSIDLSGYADRRGTPRYNQHLSQRRAAAVRRVLTRAGIPKARIHTEAYGDSRATAAIGDTEGYVFDRRVTLRLRAPAAALAKE